MISLIADNTDAIAAICREYRIRKLDLFGSAATGDFDPETSDIDFVVDLGAYERGVSRRFLQFADALEALLGRRIDVITDEQLRNPYFRQSVQEQRVNVYNAEDSEAAA